MPDYIEREAALNFIATVECRPSELEAVKNALQVYSDHISSLPAADVQPIVHGKWIPVTNGRGGCECNMCHAYAPSYQSGSEYKSHFCPNCGARMDLEAETDV